MISFYTPWKHDWPEMDWYTKKRQEDNQLFLLCWIYLILNLHSCFFSNSNFSLEKLEPDDRILQLDVKLSFSCFAGQKNCKTSQHLK